MGLRISPGCAVEIDGLLLTMVIMITLSECILWVNPLPPLFSKVSNVANTDLDRRGEGLVPPPLAPVKQKVAICKSDICSITTPIFQNQKYRVAGWVKH